MSLVLHCRKVGLSLVCGEKKNASKNVRLGRYCKAVFMDIYSNALSSIAQILLFYF